MKDNSTVLVICIQTALSLLEISNVLAPSKIGKMASQTNQTFASTHWHMYLYLYI